MCDFCEEKFIHSDGTVNGTGCCNTMKMNMNMLFATAPEDGEEIDGIQLEKSEDNENYLKFDSSSGEYNQQFIAIKYCPFCGKEL